MERAEAKLLSELQEDCRQTIAQLSQKAGMSASACHRRLRSLEEVGIIEGYGARLSAKKLGLTLYTLVDIRLSSQSKKAMDEFEAAVQHTPEILECLLLSGEADYRLRIAVRDIDELDHVHREQLAKLPGVSSIQTTFVMRSVKQWTGLHLT